MRAKIRKWGHSLALRIPKAFAAETRLAEGVAIDISVQDGKLVVVPVTADYDLADLLARVTPETLHGEVDTGEPTGREVW